MHPIGIKGFYHAFLGSQVVCSRLQCLLQVLVKVLAVGVCHSDSVVQEGLFGNSFPIIPGHEIIGNVVAVPDSENQWKEGDRVGGPWHGGHDGEYSPKYLHPVRVGDALT
jgi:threonine dehydrogenase-like Zn-dependent dehydrogenase